MTSDGGPAFPTIIPGFAKEGMSLRAWLAGEALSSGHYTVVNGTDGIDCNQTARLCIRQADAIIKELEEP